MAEENNQADQLAEYRKWIIAAEQKSQEDFDKTVLSLSGGALGISFIFLRDVIGPHPIVSWHFLLYAWMAWAFSTFSILISFYLSRRALRMTITQIDSNKIYRHRQNPGGTFARLTEYCNIAGAVLFLVGVCCITIFVGANLSAKGALNERKEIPVNTTATSNSTTSNNNSAARTKSK